MKYIDIHTHRAFPRAEELIVRDFSLEEAVSGFSGVSDSFSSIGIHPWKADNVSEADYNRLEKLCGHENVRLIGECGLDKNKGPALEIQISVFDKQIAISEKMKKPMIIHCVGYFNELINIKRKVKASQTWIIHGFRGKPQLAEQLLKAGFSLSFGAKFNPESVKLTPMERLFVETDESEKALSEIYFEIAALKACSIDKLNAGSQLLRC